MIILKQDTIEKYRKVSDKIVDPVLLCKLRSRFERSLSLAELLEWLHEKVKWSKGDVIRQ